VLKPSLLPAVERAMRFALNRRGFTSRDVPTPAALLHAFDARGRGSLPPMAVLHGIGSAATSFWATMERIRPHVRRIVAPDLPGHGFSASPSARLTPQALFDSVATALDGLFDEPMLLVGNSLGGALSLNYAVARPERVLGLVLISPAGARVSEEEWRTVLRLFQIDSVAEARQLLDRIYHRMPWYMPAFAPDLRTTMQRQAIRDLLESATLDDLVAPERLRALQMPILLLWGRSERVLPASSLVYFREHLPPQAVIEEPAGFGHCPHLDCPGRLAARIVEFARQSAAPSFRRAV
jgi:pimeloyl-ACP methyl ester carboxylesterase